MRGVLALVLAGGKGARLEPLTRDRSKPAVPFGGCYRIIDFTLSNCINSGLRRILVLTQYKAASLDRHLAVGWQFLCRELDEFIEFLPPEQRLDEHWYQGTADAVYQNIFTIERAGPEHILILSGDHIYKMDYSKLLRDHVDANADATIACIPVPVEEADRFGIMQVDQSRRVVSFREKPDDPDAMPDDPNRCLASMGIYVFKASFLFEQLCQDATRQDSRRDFGRDIIPSIIDSSLVRAWPFRDEQTGDACYWRDVGTLDSYYEANMDLVSVDPQLNLYEPDWPIRTYQPPDPPPKFVFSQFESERPRIGHALDSLVCSGTIISGGRVQRSIVGRNVRVNSWAKVDGSILFEGVDVGRHARVRNAIIDKGVHIPPGVEIGCDPEADRQRGFTITESGIVTIGRADAPIEND